MQLEAPQFTWYEVASTWLPANYWAWLVGGGFWGAVAAALLPGIFRLPRAGWHQGMAALGLTIFLLALPAYAGVQTRSRIGFILEKNTGLRLTPTDSAQVITRLAAGTPARFENARGHFVLIRTSPEGIRGWVDREQFGLVSSDVISPPERASLR